MKLKVILYGILFFFIMNCDYFDNYIEVEINDTVKVSSNYFTDKNEALVFAWTPPKSEAGIVPKFEIKDNYLYFSPDFEGNYTVELSIETLGGEILTKEKFKYKAVYQIDLPGKSYESSTLPLQTISKKKRIDPSIKRTYFTVQVYSRTEKKEAEYDFSKLQDMGYDDVYIEEFINKDILYWRVRTGHFNSRKKAEKRKIEISNILKIKPENLWALKVN